MKKIAFSFLIIIGLYLGNNASLGKAEKSEKKLKYALEIGSEIIVKVDDTSQIIISKDENRWWVQSLIKNEKMLHLVVPIVGGGSWCAVDDLVNKGWVVDCEIDGNPDWKGRSKQDREIVSKISYIPIKELDSPPGTWEAEGKRYMFDIKSKSYSVVK